MLFEDAQHKLANCLSALACFFQRSFHRNHPQSDSVFQNVFQNEPEPPTASQPNHWMLIYILFFSVCVVFYSMQMSICPTKGHVVLCQSHLKGLQRTKLDKYSKPQNICFPPPSSLTKRIESCLPRSFPLLFLEWT